MKHLYESILDDEDDILDDRSSISNGLDKAILYMKKFLDGTATENASTIFSVVVCCLGNYYSYRKYTPEVSQEEYNEFIGMYGEAGVGDKEFLYYLKRTMLNNKLIGNTCTNFFEYETFVEKSKYTNDLLGKLNKCNTNTIRDVENIISRKDVLVLVIDDLETIALKFVFHHSIPDDLYFIIMYPKQKYLEKGNKFEIEFLNELFKLITK